MKFEEILEPLRNGKSVRRKCWAKDCLIEFNKEKELSYVGTVYTLSYVLELEDLNATDWEIYEEPILTGKEREYLSAVIKPFRERTEYIMKFRSPSWEHLKICVESNIFIENKEIITLPCFEANSMYKGMEVDKHYTLEELGL